MLKQREAQRVDCMSLLVQQRRQFVRVINVRRGKAREQCARIGLGKARTIGPMEPDGAPRPDRELVPQVPGLLGRKGDRSLRLRVSTARTAFGRLWSSSIVRRGRSGFTKLSCRPLISPPSRA